MESVALIFSYIVLIFQWKHSIVIKNFILHLYASPNTLFKSFELNIFRLNLLTYFMQHYIILFKLQTQITNSCNEVIILI